jgi:hypothetical protein
MNALPRVTLSGRRACVIPLGGKKTDLHRSVLPRHMATVLSFSNFPEIIDGRSIEGNSGIIDVEKW